MNVKTNVHAGQCSATWYMGTVQDASGGGFYGSLIDDNGILRYYNQSYTQFCPQGKGLWVGERVLFAPITEPGDRYGKVGCVTQMSCTTTS